jgi:hypothetical protein
MINESEWHEVSYEDVKPEAPVIHKEEKLPSPEVLKTYYAEQQKILERIRTYPMVDPAVDPEAEAIVKISDTTDLIHTPYVETLTTNTESLSGLQGFNPLKAESGVTIELKNPLMTEFEDDKLERFGVHSYTQLTIGVHGDNSTLKQMEQFLDDHPHYPRTRLFTSFTIDANGKGIKKFVLPQDIHIDESTTREIRPLLVGSNGIKEKTVYKDISSSDLELIGFALHTLSKTLPTEPATLPNAVVLET